MTPSEHYLRAEELADQAEREHRNALHDHERERAAHFTALAHVHATLALSPGMETP